MDDIAVIQGGIQKQARRRPVLNRYPFLRVANVTAAGLDLREVHEIELFGAEIDRYSLLKGDLLVVEGNGSASQIGRAALWDGSLHEAVHQNHLIRVRPGPLLLPEYLEAVWNSPENRRRLRELASSSSGLYTLSVSKLKSVQIPVASLDVQRRAVARLDTFNEARHQMEKNLHRARQRVNVLRRALLASAFSGQLTGSSSDVDRAIEITEADQEAIAG